MQGRELMSHWSALSEESSIPLGVKDTDSTFLDSGQSGGHGTNRHELVHQGEPLPACGNLQDNCTRVRRSGDTKVGDGGMGQTWNCGMTC